MSNETGAPSAPTAKPKTPDARASRLVVIAGGDVSLGRGAGQRILKDPSYDPFREIAAVLAAADLRFVNLESQLSNQRGETQSPHNPLVFTGPPAGADVLARAHIDVVSLANNHAWDYGRSAFLETMGNLSRTGVAYVGASSEPGRQYEPTVLHVKGWSVALFAVTNIWNQGRFQEHTARNVVAWADFGRLEQRLERARQEHDIVLLSYHGGSEYVDVPMTWTRHFVNAAMRTGVHALIGHHPHIPHGIEWFGGRPAFYSLGNLVFAMHNDHVWTGQSFLSRLTFHESGLIEVEACPFQIIGHVPTLYSGKTKQALERAFVRHLSRLSLGLGGVEVGEPGEFSCVPLREPRRKLRPLYASAEKR